VTEDEEARLRSAALQNSAAIVQARRRAEQELLSAREALRESAEMLRATFAQAAVGMAIIAPDGRLLEVNQRFCDTMGYPAGELKLMTAFDFTHPDELPDTHADVQRLVAGEISSYARERRYIRKDRAVIWLLTSVTLLRDESGAPRRFISVVEDITQRKQAEAEREAAFASERAARAEAERLGELKDQFLATLSHELRTPLSAILGWTQILLRRELAREEQLKAVEVIERNARIQTQLIEDLLDMSRIASGKLRLDVQPLEPSTFVEAAVQTVRPAAEAKGIRLETVIDPFAGPISGDPGRLQQVVWNLLSNAIKFTAKGGKVQVVLQRVNSHIEIVVADNGIGIQPEFLIHVFERFRQADASTTRNYSGLGLGLSIVKQLVELHGGTIRAQSAGRGQGSTFTVELPVVVAHRQNRETRRIHPAAPTAAAADYRVADLSGLRILVVDDEPDARTLIQRLLEDCGAEVFTAANVGEALSLVRSAKLHLLVSDIGMPGADGYQLLEQVRELDDPALASLPAIALTAFARSEDRTRALRSGFVLHLSKPVEPAELIATVASAASRTGKRL
jgi:PAS domain S-box-containing protein